MKQDPEISVTNPSDGYYKIRVGKQVIRLTSGQFRRLRRESKEQNPTKKWFDRHSHYFDTDSLELDIDEEFQVVLLHERFTELNGVGEKTASKIIDLLITEGFSGISPESISDLNGVDHDTAEKIWIYIAGLHDATNNEFEQLV
jgi:hypothetical protein